MHDTLKSAVEVVPVLLWNSNFDSSIQKEKQFLQLQQLFCCSFNDSDHHGTNNPSGEHDSALSIFLKKKINLFLLSLFAHLYGISATRRHLRHFFGSLYLPFVSGYHVIALKAASPHQGGIGVLWKLGHQDFEVEAVHVASPSILMFQLVMGGV
jgi:hypothetical protein